MRVAVALHNQRYLPTWHPNYKYCILQVKSTLSSLDALLGPEAAPVSSWHWSGHGEATILKQPIFAAVPAIMPGKLTVRLPAAAPGVDTLLLLALPPQKTPTVSSSPRPAASSSAPASTSSRPANPSWMPQAPKPATPAQRKPNAGMSFDQVRGALA